MDAVADAAADDAGTEVETMLFPTALSPLLFLPRPQTPGLPTSRGNDAVTSGNTKKLRCTHQGCPSPRTHDTSACKYHAQLVLVRKREREQAACAAGDALPSPAINLAMAPLPLIILVCLILILPTLHVCLLLQHPRTRQNHCPLSHSGLVSRPLLQLAMLQLTMTRKKTLYSKAAPQ